MSIKVKRQIYQKIKQSGSKVSDKHKLKKMLTN